MRLAAGLRPDPLGVLEHSPRSPNRNWVCLLLRGRGGKGKREGRGWEGRREEGWGGEGGKGMDDLHPTLFLGSGGEENTPRLS